MTDAERLCVLLEWEEVQIDAGYAKYSVGELCLILMYEFYQVRIRTLHKTTYNCSLIGGFMFYHLWIRRAHMYSPRLTGHRLIIRLLYRTDNLTRRWQTDWASGNIRGSTVKCSFFVHCGPEMPGGFNDLACTNSDADISDLVIRTSYLIRTT